MLETGKLDSELLKRIVFEKITYRSDDVKVRPGIGEDCAVMDFGDYECIMSTDPITAAVSDIGRLAIHITCNDIASNGVQPLGIMLAVMLPEGTTADDVEHIMGQAAETAADLKVEIIGGHTEVTPAVNQPVIVSTAIGKAVNGKSQSGNDMEAGDFVMMTKTAGLEGTGIIACDYGEHLEDAMSKEELARAVSFLDMVSVVPEGIAAGKVGTHGMHDITEGGILGAAWEMCQIAGKGVQIWENTIPMEPETEKICEYFHIDPLRLISSGSMVIIVPADKKEAMEAAMAESGVAAQIIGRIEDKNFGIRLFSEGGVDDADKIAAAGGGIEVAPPSADELYRVVGKY